MPSAASLSVCNCPWPLSMVQENEKDHKFHQTILMLKMIETNLLTHLRELKDLNEIKLQTDTPGRPPLSSSSLVPFPRPLLLSPLFSFSLPFHSARPLPPFFLLSLLPPFSMSLGRTHIHELTHRHSRVVSLRLAIHVLLMCMTSLNKVMTKFLQYGRQAATRQEVLESPLVSTSTEVQVTTEAKARVVRLVMA